MTKKTERYKALFEETESMQEMSNLVQSNTGLSNVIWIMIKTGREKHNARIKVRDNSSNLIPLTISDSPKWIIEPDLKRKDRMKIENWVKLNRSLLLKYWLRGEEIDLVNFIPSLTRV